MGETTSVLVVDDDADVLKAATFILKGDVDVVDALASAEGLEAQLASRRYDAVLLDMNFSPGIQTGSQGLSTLEQISRLDPAVSVVLMTAYGGVSLAVEALKRGATDFVLKPWNNQALLATLLAATRATRARRASTESFDLKALERTAIRRALDHCDGNVSHAAEILGLTRGALYRRMAKHAL